METTRVTTHDSISPSVPSIQPEASVEKWPTGCEDLWGAVRSSEEELDGGLELPVRGATSSRTELHGAPGLVPPEPGRASTGQGSEARGVLVLGWGGLAEAALTPAAGGSPGHRWPQDAARSPAGRRHVAGQANRRANSLTPGRRRRLVSRTLASGSLACARLASQR